MGFMKKFVPSSHQMFVESLDEAGTLTMGNPMPEVEGMQDHRL